MKEEEQIENERVKRRNPATEEKIKKLQGTKRENRKQEIMKEEEKIENERVKRRNPSTEEKIMLNIPYPKPYISSGFPN